jgi:hypothetical protein
MPPIRGRWISKDPLGFRATDSNLYRYAWSDPVSLTDPDGRILPAAAAALCLLGGLAAAGPVALAGGDLGDIGAAFGAGALAAAGGIVLGGGVGVAAYAGAVFAVAADITTNPNSNPGSLVGSAVGGFYAGALTRLSPNDAFAVGSGIVHGAGASAAFGGIGGALYRAHPFAPGFTPGPGFSPIPPGPFGAGGDNACENPRCEG